VPATARFRDLLASVGVDGRTSSTFYQIRSGILHGSRVLVDDIDGPFSLGLDPGSFEFYTSYDTCEEAARFAMLSLGAGGGAGLEAAEVAIRAAMTKVGASLLAGLLAADAGYRGQAVDCGAGHLAQFVSYRDKTFGTVLGPCTVNRAWYHCAPAVRAWPRGTPNWGWPGTSCRGAWRR
jgi:hypothetical protein